MSATPPTTDDSAENRPDSICEDDDEPIIHAFKSLMLPINAFCVVAGCFWLWNHLPSKNF
ncbi:hypothetical protein PRIPAC_74554, partial [Pristionchus pacificus]|uniref:Uncharacterized protein n=1 Tax=Pristionchus pacificus TaxID=54126 RepID=A0A2A6CEJ5_PRIPA